MVQDVGYVIPAVATGRAAGRGSSGSRVYAATATEAGALGSGEPASEPVASGASQGRPATRMEGRSELEGVRPGSAAGSGAPRRVGAERPWLVRSSDSCGRLRARELVEIQGRRSRNARCRRVGMCSRRGVTRCRRPAGTGITDRWVDERRPARSESAGGVERGAMGWGRTSWGERVLCGVQAATVDQFGAERPDIPAGGVEVEENSALSHEFHASRS